MKLSWVTPFLVRLLSLTRFASATGGESSALTVGIRLNLPAASSEPLSQPLLSLDPNLFVQYGSNELSVPIMPLHLLGKKSWNVYNHDNIEKVKRDEAAARAKEEAEEQRMQEIDAQRRIQILRGEEPTPLPEIEEAPDDSGRKRRSDDGSGRERKKLRRGYGENETDWEMRVAQEQNQASNTDKQVVLRKPATADAPLVDHSGHIDLFPQEHKKVSVEKNVDAEREKKKKERELEDQYTMRFSNAAGFKQGLDNPWYSKVTAEKETEDEPISKDVWGNEDPRRKQRQAARTVASDPLAAMRQGAAKVRQVERERKRWREEKEKEIELLEAEERRKRRKRRYEDYEEDDLEDFSLDRPGRSSPRHRDDDHERERRHRHKESRRSSHREEGHRHRHRDEDRRHRHRHRSRD